MTSFKKSRVVFLFIAVLVFASLLCVGCQKNEVKPKDIGIAWCKETNYKNVVLSVNEAGGNPVLLNQVKYNGIKYDGNEVSKECLDDKGMIKTEYAEKIKSKPYDDTNVKEVLDGQNVIIFSGGADICPSLYKHPQPWYSDIVEPKFDTARDVSDYITMSYCLDNNIPVLGICRGMQLYGIVAGGEMIQDLPTYYKEKGLPYNDEHIKSEDLHGLVTKGNHPVYIYDKENVLYEIFNKFILDVPYSSHHQAVKSINPDKSKVVALAKVDGLETIEALERIDSDAFGLFVQFHPEHSLARWVNNAEDKENFMSYEDSLKIFKYIVDKVA